MSNQISPFAELSGAEKQIRWLEYQSIQLPYIDAALSDHLINKKQETKQTSQVKQSTTHANIPQKREAPKSSPEVPRAFSVDFTKTRHAQYDAVIARMKQAELQTRKYFQSNNE